MDSIVYDIVWPGGNTTAIVRSHVPVTDYVSVAKRILAKHPEIEQVGYLLAPYHPAADGRLAMMGGEFCGNATRCTVFLLAQEAGRPYAHAEIPGLGEAVEGMVTQSESSIRLPMDFCLNIAECPEGSVVDLQGIRHVVITKPTEEPKESLIAKYKDKLPAVGLMYLSRVDGVTSIDPYVWVRDTETFYHETACGSGSLAVGFVLHREENIREVAVRQPSGADLTVKFHDKPASVTLSGPIKIVGRKTLG